MNNFCPLINSCCNSNCIFLEQKPNASGYGISNHCSLSGAIKQSQSKPDAEILVELKNLIKSKI